MTAQTVRIRGEATFAILLVVFAALAFWQSHAISGFSGLSEPGVFPMLASATMLVSSLFVLRGVLRKDLPASPRGSALRDFLAEALPARLVMMVALVLAYVIALPLFGFVVASALFLFSAFWVMWRRGPLVALVLSAASLGGIYLIFRTLFQVVLPRGTLFPGLF